MYFGSVKFFKHLIILTVLLIIIALTVATIHLIVSNKSFKKQINDYESNIVFSQMNNETQAGYEPESMEYQHLYPEMTAELASDYCYDTKTVYLTFDDGPSDRTIEILDILKEENIKATFFIIGKEGDKEKAIMKRIVDEGHTIAIHTYSHDYNKIYDSVDSYLEDFNKIYNHIYEITGVKADIFRFPGGSINTYNSYINRELHAEMYRRGFTYYDWNASSGDAEAKSSKNSVLLNTIKTAGDSDRIILLMHDSSNKTYTVAALPEVIEYFKSKNYKFDRLTNDVRPVSFSYNY